MHYVQDIAIMNTSKEYTGTASAAKDYFGDHPNGEIKFLLEWKSLTDSDKEEIKQGLKTLGYVITDRHPG